jgi:uncharacterized protein (DUF433 family)
MNATNVLERVPIHTDAEGVVRVAGTRVTLESVVDAFETGATAEEIAQQYPTVPLVDVYSVITYYLRHKPDVDAYRVEREAAAGRVREEVERRFASTGVRERLLARRRLITLLVVLVNDEGGQTVVAWRADATASSTSMRPFTVVAMPRIIEGPGRSNGSGSCPEHTPTHNFANRRARDSPVVT